MVTVENLSNDPFYNQAFEEYVFYNYKDDDVFLLWQNRPAVVVGCYQNICREVHVESLRKQGISLVRRMSGGGTVYHDLGNINYTYITRQDGLVDYDVCMKPVIEALNDLGIPAHKNRASDIAIGDLKISGSAQRSAGGRVLHHGTLLFESDLTVLDQITTHHKNDCFQSKGTISAICSVTNIRDHLKEPMTLEEFQERLLNRMVPPGNPHLRLTPEQEMEVKKLRDEKYRSWDWTWKKNPAFIYEKAGTFSGSPIRVSYQAKKGIVSEVQIDCKMLDCALAARLLDGIRLDPECFENVCLELVGNRAEELMNWLL